jgi:hypothetical protein
LSTSNFDRPANIGTVLEPIFSASDHDIGSDTSNARSP